MYHRRAASDRLELHQIGGIERSNACEVNAKPSQADPDLLGRTEREYYGYSSITSSLYTIPGVVFALKGIYIAHLRLIIGIMSNLHQIEKVCSILSVAYDANHRCYIRYKRVLILTSCNTALACSGWRCNINQPIGHLLRRYVPFRPVQAIVGSNWSESSTTPFPACCDVTLPYSRF